MTVNGCVSMAAMESFEPSYQLSSQRIVSFPALFFLSFEWYIYSVSTTACSLHTVTGKCLPNERALSGLHRQDTSKHSRGF